MTKVKICGITNLEDAQLSAKFGADALGFNFYPKSPRYILPEDARKIIDELPKDILNVGVFVNEDLEKIIEIAKIANLKAIQLHGEETPEFAKELKNKTGLEIIKAFRVSPEFKPEDVLQFEVDEILLDAYSSREHGGTGETFDWEIAKKVKEIFPKMYLAGGLNHLNVTQSLNNFNHVDVCSGVESHKGKKDYVKVVNFITRTRNWMKTKAKHNRTPEAVNFIERKLPSSIFEFLAAIHARPAMYFGEKSLTKLWIFIFGFTSALNMTNSKEILGRYDSEEYRKWMAEKVGYGYPNTIDCMIHILRKFDNDEEKSFDYYFAILEEFKLEYRIK